MSAGETSDSAEVEAAASVGMPGAGEPAAPSAAARARTKAKRPRPTFDDGALTKVFKFPSKSYPRSSHYVTGDAIIIRIKKGKKRWKLEIPKKRVRSFKTNQWFAKKRWIEIELTFTQAVRLGLVAKRETLEPAAELGGPVPAANTSGAIGASGNADPVASLDGAPAPRETSDAPVEVRASLHSDVVHTEAVAAAEADGEADNDSGDDTEGDEDEQFLLSDVTDTETDEDGFSEATGGAEAVGEAEAESDAESELDVVDSSEPAAPAPMAKSAAAFDTLQAVAEQIEAAPESLPEQVLEPQPPAVLVPVYMAVPHPDERSDENQGIEQRAAALTMPVTDVGKARLQHWWPSITVALAASVLALITAAGLKVSPDEEGVPVLARHMECGQSNSDCSAAITTGSIVTATTIEALPPAPAPEAVAEPRSEPVQAIEVTAEPAPGAEPAASEHASAEPATVSDAAPPQAAAEPIATQSEIQPAPFVSPTCAALPEVARGIAIRFETASVELDAPARSALGDLAARLRFCGSPRLVVEGHTDSDGRADRNEILSHRRAEVVRNYLIEAGVEPQRVWAIGLGQTRPYEPNVTPEQKRRNRRAAVVIDGSW